MKRLLAVAAAALALVIAGLFLFLRVIEWALS